MTKRRRLLTTGVLLLLLGGGGAIVNVAVAWGCALWVEQLPKPKTYHHLSNGKSVAFIAQQDVAGVCVVALIGSMPMSAVPWKVPSWVISYESGWQLFDARGWPLVSLWCLRDENLKPLDGISLNYTPPRIGIRYPLPAALPLRPILLNFAINTIFYAAILGVVFLVLRMVRRRIRRRRGRCPACAYPIGSSPVCTECGSPFLRDSEGGHGGINIG